MAHAFLLSKTSPAPIIFCQKVGFQSRKEACKAMNNRSKQPSNLVQTGFNRPMAAYLCQKGCGLWHVGHEPLTKRKATKNEETA